ncbi:PD-(D/E)XK nuclease family protein [Arundinibacter roseus]|uniref:PD-(D/E)XK nuclease family protein n=1 Tax=Arundinibacter roseus TaxID=2070510 RepID=A0A4R4K9P8_9BACT|nr:PD-(D/E)XK nuclease family protein [Arundinibacter roseus]TDB64557.1 PD-(D/E)XK nuclease family protein [Arundinibacter roseus]
MKSFLSEVANYLLENHESDLEQLALVVPTRRAAFFLKDELANATLKPVICPHIVAIEDFISELSTLEIADSVSLLFELFETFKTVDPNIQFDRFMGWASVLMSDLDRIDQYLVDTNYLFDYLTEAKAVERWEASLPAGRSLPQNGGAKPYFALFESINTVYHLFRERLLGQGKAYRGMAYRHVASYDIPTLLDHVAFSKVYFIGFNAFTEAEKVLIQALRKAGRAETLWDTDAYYMSVNQEVEAGISLRKYKKDLTFGPWNWTQDHLLSTSKDVYVYGVPNATLQTKVAGELYTQLLLTDDPEHPVPTAIVLADENLLLPMLYSLDDRIKDFNITMGLSLRNSMLYTLVDSIFELQQQVAEFRTKDGRTLKIPKFNHKTISKVLNHPFIRHYEQVVLRPLAADEPTIVQKTLREINQNNRVFLSTHELLTIGESHRLFEVLFTRWDKNDSRQVIQSMYQLIDLLRDVYKDYKNALETEYLYLFFTLLKQFEQTVANRPEPLTLRTLRSFLFDLIRTTKIPFSGEPVSALQILGMLETRALDFSRVIIISLNEGTLPQAKRQNSLIPFDIAKESGLPTHLHQEAVMSYHFYRLLQRASEVHLMYVNTTDAMGGGEKSRFIQQLEYELTAYNPAFKIHNRVVAFDEQAFEPLAQEVPKDDAMLARIRTYLAEKGLYPTHINDFIRCSMKFYLSRIVGVEDKEEIEEELGMDKIGTWLHAALETLDQDYFLLGKDPTDEQIKAVLREEFDALFTGYVTDMGLNRVYYQIGEQQILAFLKFQIENPDRRKVLAAEKKIQTTLHMSVHGQSVQLLLGGKIDRVEQDNSQTLFVMDYKTGSVELAAEKKNTIQDRIEKLRLDPALKAGYARQLWLYKYLVYKALEQPEGLVLGEQTYRSANVQVQAGFYSFRNPTKTFENQLEITDSPNAAQFIAESEKLIQEIVAELLNPESKFTQTTDRSMCQYCDFKGICAR